MLSIRTFPLQRIVLMRSFSQRQANRSIHCTETMMIALPHSLRLCRRSAITSSTVAVIHFVRLDIGALSQEKKSHAFYFVDPGPVPSSDAIHLSMW